MTATVRSGSKHVIDQICVDYNSAESFLCKALMTCGALDSATHTVHTHLVLNAERDLPEKLEVLGERLRVYRGHGNVGFARANNIALSGVVGTWVLIINPDASVPVTSLLHAADFLEHHPDAVMVVPWVTDGRGDFQYLNRKRPGWKHLLARGMPGYGRWWGRRMQADYELRDKDWSVPREDFDVASGCCMLIRREALEKVGGFDPGFFLYFEDYDLTLRLRELGRVVYLPAFRVVHHGGHVARKSWRHWWYFFRSAIRFSNKHGWRWN